LDILLQIEKPEMAPESSEPEIVVESTADVARVMGFAGFGDSKKAMQFDMEKMFSEARQKAADRYASNNLKLTEDGKACLEQVAQPSPFF
jgi:hypothetical protein